MMREVTPWPPRRRERQLLCVAERRFRNPPLVADAFNLPAPLRASAKNGEKRRPPGERSRAGFAEGAIPCGETRHSCSESNSRSRKIPATVRAIKRHSEHVNVIIECNITFLFYSVQLELSNLIFRRKFPS